MKEKVRHHPILTGIILGGIFCVAGYTLEALVHVAWVALAGLGWLLFILSLIWEGKYELVCPQCNHSVWNKTNYYCSNCGVRLVFKGKQKVKSGEKVKPEKIPEPYCSKGHRVYSFDKYCGKCGEKLES